MTEGKILAASHNGSYVIRLQGDVRLTLCTTIDEYIQQMLSDPNFASVWVDLCQAEGVDSTTLGILAKLALTVEQKFGFQPAIYSCEPSITRLLRSMGFQRLFAIYETVCAGAETPREIPLVEGSEAAVREQVIDAHRVLMDMSDDNKARFQNLMNALQHS